MVQINHASIITRQWLDQYTVKGSTKPKEDQSNEKTGNPATQVTISDDAYNRYSTFRELRLQLTDSGENEKLDENFRAILEKLKSEKESGQYWREFEERSALKSALHPLENEFQIYGVKYGLTEGTIQHTIASALEDKVINPSLYAHQLAEAIRGNQEQSIEERAIYREIALQQAQYVADNYFDNEEESQSFLTEIKKAAENAVLSERGYYVHEDKTYRKYSGPLESNGGVSMSVLAKRYMDEEYYERFVNLQGTAEEFGRFLMDIYKNEAKYRNEIATEFEAEEKVILEQMNNAKALVSDITWDNNNFVETIESLLQDLDYGEIAKWNRNMLKLFL